MITTLTGENGFGVRQELRRLVDAFVQEHGDLALVRMDGAETTYAEMQQVIESVPFLASRKLVILTTPSAQKEFIDRATSVLKDVADTTDVIIVEPKLDKRSSYYKFLKSHTEFHEHAQMDGGQLAPWLVRRATEQGGSVSSADARYLVERVGANQQLLGNELTKLIQYDPAVTRKTIDLLTEANPHSTIFELMDAVMSGQTARAMRLYEEQRMLRVEPQQVIAMLAWQLHVMAVVVSAGSRSDADVARDARMSPYVVKKTRGLVQGRTLRDVRELVSKLLQIDTGSKSGTFDIDQALRNFIVGA